MTYVAEIKKIIWHCRYFCLFLILFTFAVAAKLNLSSVAMWDYYLDGAKAVPKGILAGSPQGIRSDEWMLGVPWTLSQVNGIPALDSSNPSIGAESSALLVGLPTNHWSALFRPSQWGYLFLDVEHAFSWQWMIMSLGLFFSLFLLFKRLTDDSAILALTGALWVFFSGFTQWWFASLAALLFAFSASCVSFSYLWCSTKWKGLLLSSFAYFFFAVNFSLMIYPAFQVPLLYLGLALLPILTASFKKEKRLGLPVRLAALTVASLGCLLIVVLFLHDNKAAVSIMDQTVYPGKRLSLGGGFDFTRYFSGIYDSTYIDGRLPLGYGNVCEASSFLLLWPLSLFVLFFSNRYSKLLKFIPLLFYLFASSFWVIYGGSEWIARNSLWAYVPSNRALIGLGFGSVVLVVTVIGQKIKIPVWLGVIVLSGLTTGLFFFMRHFDIFANDLLPDRSLFYASMGAGLVFIAILFSSRMLLLTSVILAVAWPNSQINPVMRGLDSILKTRLYRAVKKIDSDRSEVWAVYGSHIAPQLVKAAGASVLNGAKYIPDLTAFKQLDPEGKYSYIYNRYAHGILNPVAEGSPIVFTLSQADTWQLDLDPCHPALKALGVRYVVFMPRRKDLTYSCLKPVAKGKDFAILKRTDF